MLVVVGWAEELVADVTLALVFVLEETSLLLDVEVNSAVDVLATVESACEEVAEEVGAEPVTSP